MAEYANGYGRVTKRKQWILTELAKGRSMASVAKEIGCSYQAVQRVKRNAFYGRASGKVA